MQKRKKYTWLKWVGGIIIFVAIILFSVSFYLVRHWEPIVTEALKSSVKNSTDSLYRIDFSKIKFNLVLGDFKILNVWLKPDTNVYKRMQSQGKAPAYLFEVKVNNIALEGAHFWKVYTEKKVDINLINIERPEVTVISQYGRSEEDTTNAIRNFSPYDMIKGTLTSIEINEINFNRIKLKFIQRKTGKDSKQEFNFSNINIKDLLVDSMAQYNKERPLYTEDIRVEMVNLSYPMKDSLYYLKFKKAVFSTKNLTASMDSFRLEPRYKEIEYSNLFQYRRDRFNIAIGSMVFRNIDLRKLFYYQRLHLHELDVDKMNLDVFVNMQKDKSPEKLNGKPQFPLQIVQKINIPFTIDSIDVKNSTISYSELDKNKDFKWKIKFNNTDAQISNFTNDSVVILKKHLCVMKANTMFMNEGKLAAKFTFHIDKPDGQVEVLGSLDPFNASHMNFILVPSQKVEISSFKIKKMDFAIRANIYRAHAKMELYYNNLRIKILKTDEDNKLINSGFLSLLANLALLKKDNPSANGTFYTADYTYVRKPENSFFGLLWKTLLRGIKNTIGITEDVEAEIKARISDYKSLQTDSEKKMERKEKREERRERRAGRKQSQLLLIQNKTE